jgi:hypothetical protein
VEEAAAMSTEDATCALPLVSMSLSQTLQEAAAMSTEDARCVLCLVSMSFSHSHVVYPQLSVYVLMFVYVVKLSTHLSLPRKLRR